jgi:hypothetical protein
MVTSCQRRYKVKMLEGVACSTSQMVQYLHTASQVTGTKNKIQGHRARGPPDMECELCELGGMEWTGVQSVYIPRSHPGQVVLDRDRVTGPSRVWPNPLLVLAHQALSCRMLLLPRPVTIPALDSMPHTARLTQQSL